MKRRSDDYFARHKVKEIDYRNSEMLSRYLTNWGKIKPARETNISAHYQRMLAVAVKRARYMGLLSYTKR